MMHAETLTTLLAAATLALACSTPPAAPQKQAELAKQLLALISMQKVHLFSLSDSTCIRTKLQKLLSKE